MKIKQWLPPIMIRLFFKSTLISYSILALVLFLNLVYLGLASRLNAEDWASWVQAVGSVMAIVAAFFLGERQANSAVAAIRTADKLVTERKLESLIAIAQACSVFAQKYQPYFEENGFWYLNVAVAEFDVDMRHLVAALDSIAVHEIGSFNAVTSLIELKKNTAYLQRALDIALEFGADANNRDRGWVEYETTVVRINFSQIVKRSARLEEALRMQIAE